MFLFVETPQLKVIPRKTKSLSHERIRIKAILQTCNDVNRNRRRYSKELIEEELRNNIYGRVREGSLLGELDHPISKDPVRQMTVLFKESSHRIVELGWDGNKLVANMETVPTPKGKILKDLAECKIPVGFSFRGMGELSESQGMDGQPVYDVRPPFHAITWDAVSYPSHPKALIVKINEGALVSDLNNNSHKFYNSQNLPDNWEEIFDNSQKYEFDEENDRLVALHESSGILEKDDCICTKEGVCYLPNDFDRLVEQKIIKISEKYKLI